MIFGYARISTKEQKLDRQLDQLQQAGCDEIIQDVASGARTKRPGLDALLEKLRPGDQVIVVKLSRIGRSTQHLIQLMNCFQEKQVEFCSLSENIDTKTAMGRFTFTVMAAMAEMERELIRERTNEGLASARARGRKGGRPEGLSLEAKKKAADLMELRKAGFSVRKICEMLDIGSTATYYAYLAHARAQG